MDTSRPDFPHVAGSMAPTPGRKVEDRGLSGVPMLGRGNGRPSRPEVERVALDLLRRRGAEILATARRYSSSDEDAEDAYQRGLEILITKAPTTAEDLHVLVGRIEHRDDRGARLGQ